MDFGDGMPLAHRQQQFMAILRERPTGISSADMARVVGISRRHTQRILSTLRRLGLAVSTRNDKKFVWSTPDRGAKVRRLAMDKSRAKALARLRRQSALRALLRPVRRIVPAGRMPPPVCTAANSVFALASV